MIFDKYPYTNFHEMNDDWVIQTLREFDQKLDEFVAANSLTYADPITYNPATSYPANTVVIYNDTAYVSKQAVPAGLLPSADSEYWLLIFPFGELINGAIEDMQSQISAALEAAQDQLNSAISTLPTLVNNWMTAHPDVVTAIPVGGVKWRNLANELQSVILADYNINPTQEITFTEQGSLLVNDGTEYASTSYCRTGFLHFPAGVMVLATQANYTVGIFRYASDGTYIEYAGGVYQPGFTAIKIAENEQYRFNITTDGLSALTPADLPFGVLLYTSYTSSYAQQSDMSVLLPSNLATDVSYTNGKYVAWDTGLLRNSTSGSASDYIDITGIEKILYSRVFLVQTSTTAWGIAFYNANKEYISGVRAQNRAASNHYELATADVPETAQYVRITKHNDVSTTPVLYDYSKTVFEDYNEKIDVVSNHAKIFDFPTEDMIPINICHRGLATDGFPENTMAAFKDAVSQGWKFLETDIRSTSDGVWVLLHDSTINRTARNADGTTISGNINIADITYEQALEYDFGIYAGSAFAGTKIPTLDTFLNYCNKAHVFPVIEVKNSSITQAQADAVWAIVEKYGMQNRLMWLCSSIGGVEKFLTKNPYSPAIQTSSSNWEMIDISTLTPSSEQPYAASYKTGKNKVFHERLIGSIASQEAMDNMIDYYHYFGIYAGVYAPTTVEVIADCSDRLDMCTTQYYQYSEVKEDAIE